jgi:hypothetical protein
MISGRQSSTAFRLNATFARDRMRVWSGGSMKRIRFESNRYPTDSVPPIAISNSFANSSDFFGSAETRGSRTSAIASS